ncbi:MAG: hypothetical protein JO037_15580 [Actinobacteria bacterium]|nr:hypothetical protein [Actinomycetota bacterium]
MSELLEMIELEAPLRFGMGPSGGAGSNEAPADDWTGGTNPDDAGVDGVAGVAGVTEVTVTVAVAEGGVHFADVATLAVAVSFTEVTEVAPESTGICACRTVGCLSETELMAHLAVPSPLAQPPVNVGFWLDGCEARVTDTLEADPFWAETRTT